MIRTVVFVGPWPDGPRRWDVNFRIETWHDWCPVGGLWCRLDAPACVVVYATVNPSRRRERIGHAMMFELERRWPGVTTSDAEQTGLYSIPSWFALRSAIMAAGDPHCGRPDLGPYIAEYLSCPQL